MPIKITEEIKKQLAIYNDPEASEWQREDAKEYLKSLVSDGSLQDDAKSEALIETSINANAETPEWVKIQAEQDLANRISDGSLLNKAEAEHAISAFNSQPSGSWQHEQAKDDLAIHLSNDAHEKPLPDFDQRVAFLPSNDHSSLIMAAEPSLVGASEISPALAMKIPESSYILDAPELKYTQIKEAPIDETIDSPTDEDGFFTDIILGVIGTFVLPLLIAGILIGLLINPEKTWNFLKVTIKRILRRLFCFAIAIALGFIALSELDNGGPTFVACSLYLLTFISAMAAARAKLIPLFASMGQIAIVPAIAISDPKLLGTHFTPQEIIIFSAGAALSALSFYYDRKRGFMVFSTSSMIACMGAIIPLAMIAANIQAAIMSLMAILFLRGAFK